MFLLIQRALDDDSELAWLRRGLARLGWREADQPSDRSHPIDHDATTWPEIMSYGVFAFLVGAGLAFL